MLLKQCFFTALLILGHMALCSKSASLLDFFDWELPGEISEKKTEIRSEDEPHEPITEPNCICDGPSCICCVDFNMTIVDLGGPGCVRMKYLSQDQGFAVNVSYGNRVIHSSTIKDSQRICVNVFARVAQLCARFSELAPADEGLRGCMHLEPALLGEPQVDFPLGCFRSNSVEGMVMEQPETSHSDNGDTDEDTNDTQDNLSAEALIQAVNESAEQGIAFFTSLLGLNFGGLLKPANGTNSGEQQAKTSEFEIKSPVSITAVNSNPNTRNARQLINPKEREHPNLL